MSVTSSDLRAFGFRAWGLGSRALLAKPKPIWGFPKIVDPNIVP